MYSPFIKYKVVERKASKRDRRDSRHAAKTLEGNIIRTHQIISIISMSLIAIPFDSVAHSEQTPTERKPFFVHPREER